MYDNNRERFENLWMRPWIMYCIVNIYSSVVTESANLTRKFCKQLQTSGLQDK